MKVKYVGPYESVSLSPGGGRTVAHGETIKVPDELGASLLEQPDNWVASRAKVTAGDEPEPDDAAVVADVDDDEIT